MSRLIRNKIIETMTDINEIEMLIIWDFNTVFNVVEEENKLKKSLKKSFMKGFLFFL